ncbi:hypothetical protein ARMGADRAFT_1048120 [Armillaria gallica]|uniref:DDE-1 domain-containing protein n=1 Tax=Armillaria gallica TaxID=47427 RepID=A0A2H3CTQ4_ARMGA|nr:hypothetical protein ARMGADRAFT_1048120 [Armillaria gallica]
MTGHPVNKHTIRPKVQALIWSGLDPKCAKVFNYTTEHMETYKISWENIYNMDKKGIQLEDRRRGSQWKYFFSWDNKSKYKLNSDDLQLVTIIKAACTDGTKCNVSTKLNTWHTTHITKSSITDDYVELEWFKQDFIEYIWEHNVHLFCLPPYMTHCLQPLNVSIFGLLQNTWFNQCDKLLEATREATELRDVVTEYMKAQ